MSEATTWVPLARLAEEMNMNLFSLKRSLKGKGFTPQKIVINGRAVDAITSIDAWTYQAGQNTTTPIDTNGRPDRSRVQLDLSPRAMALLTEIKAKTEATTYAEVFKNAMKLYDGIISENERGSTFMVRDKEGKISEFRMFLW